MSNAAISLGCAEEVKEDKPGNKAYLEEAWGIDGMPQFNLYDPHQLGRFGEALAARYMEARGYAVCEKNYRTLYGEADIVCRRNGETVLVEVKTRLGSQAFPEESVTPQKLRRYRRMTLDYLGRESSEEYVRFDVIALNVVDPHTARLHHYAGLCSWEG